MLLGDGLNGGPGCNPFALGGCKVRSEAISAWKIPPGVFAFVDGAFRAVRHHRNNFAAGLRLRLRAPDVENVGEAIAQHVKLGGIPKPVFWCVFHNV